MPILSFSTTLAASCVCLVDNTRVEGSDLRVINKEGRRLMSVKDSFGSIQCSSTSSKRASITKLSESNMFDDDQISR